MPNHFPQSFKFFPLFSLSLLLFTLLPLTAQEYGIEQPVQGEVSIEKAQSGEQYYINADHTQTFWYLEMQKEQPNVIEAENAFLEYFHEHPQEMSKQRKLFTRWLTVNRASVDEAGFLKVQKLEKYADLGASKSKGSNPSKSLMNDWRMIGPYYHVKNKCDGESSGMSGGYVDRTYINPYNTQNMFAGYSYGGLWVSQDEGTTWALTDAEFPNGTNSYANNDRYYGDIKACETSPATIYAATEAGLLKSTDSGNNWDYCADLNRTVDMNKRPYFVTVAPDNADIVVSTFGKNVFRSIDGGDSWTLAFDNTGGGNEHYFTNQHVTTNYGLYSRTYNFFGLEIDYGNPDVLYLGVWNASNEPCIYKSTNGGVSFSFLINLNTVNGQTMPNNLKLVSIGATTGKFYVYPEWQTNNTFYTYDANGTLLQSNGLNTNSQAGDLSFTDEDVFYNGKYFASSIYKSLDRGASFFDMMYGSYGGCPDGDKYVHADVRSIDVVGNLVLIGTDGGLTISKDGMLTAKTVGDEISAADLWGFGSSHRSDICVAGMDHGPSTVRKFDGVDGWEDRGGGDAIHASVNQAYDRWVYYDSAYGVFREFVNADGTLFGKTNISLPFNVNRLEFHPNIYTTGYGISANVLYKTEDNFASTSVVHTFGSNIKRFRASKENAEVFYALLNNNQVQKSIDGGASWTNVSASFGSNFVDLALGESNELFLLSGTSNNTNKVLQSTDGGTTWMDRTSANLPTVSASEIAYQMGTDGGLYIAYAGMHGVWYRNNTMAQWEQLGGDSPPMFGYVKNAFTVPNKGKFRMGSSRGSWEHDLYESSVPIANFSVERNQVTCSDQLIGFVDNSTALPGMLTYAWSFPGASPATSTNANPVVSYPFPGSYDVSLTITDSNNQSHTRLLTDFITVTNDCDEEKLFPYIETIDCNNPIPSSGLMNAGDQVLVKDFSIESGDEFYVDLNISTDCYDRTANLKAIVDLYHNKINVISYNHFNVNALSPIFGTETDSLTSFGTDFGQVSFVLSNGALYLKSVSNACGSSTKLEASCWTSLCGGTIPQTSWMSAGDEVLIKDFATETGDIFYVNLKSYVNCYGKTANLIALVDIPNQQIQVESYHHFNATTSGGYNGDGTNEVISVSAAFGKVAFRIDGTELYFRLVGQACGSTGRLLESCYYGFNCAPLLGQSCDDGDSCTVNDLFDNDCNCNGTYTDSDGDGTCDANEGVVSFKVFLEGAYNTQTGTMKKELFLQNLIPLSQPYNLAPYNYMGAETLTALPANMIDWVLVEVREGFPSLSGIRGTTTLETKAGILLETGDIVDVNGLPLAFDSLIGGQSYYFCIRHRNHLDVLTGNPMSIGANNFYDFTFDNTQAFGTNQMKTMVDGKSVLFAADLTQDGVIQTTDYDMWKANPAILNSYIPTDANLDGSVQTSDYDMWFINKAKIGTVEIDF